MAPHSKSHPPSEPGRRILTRRVCSTLALAVGASICLLIFLAQPDPRESQWQAALEIGLPILDPARAPEDFAPILDAGPDAIPFLLTQIEGTWFERFKERHWADIPPVLRDQLEEPQFPYRGQIPQVLELMEPAAREALPRLRQIVERNPESHLNLFNAIARIGRDDPATLDFLLEISLRQPASDSFRMNTASFLGFWSPSEEVANALAQFLHDSNPWVVGNTLVSLNRLGPKYIRQHLLPVTNLLTSPHPDLRENAQRILAKLNDSLAEPP